MRATQHLAKGKVEGTQARLRIRVYRVAVLMPFVMVSVGMRRFMSKDLVSLRPGMPCRVRQRALLRDKQQDHAQVMNQAAGHGRRKQREPPSHQSVCGKTTWRG